MPLPCWPSSVSSLSRQLGMPISHCALEEPNDAVMLVGTMRSSQTSPGCCPCPSQTRVLLGLLAGLALESRLLLARLVDRRSRRGGDGRRGHHAAAAAAGMAAAAASTAATATALALAARRVKAHGVLVRLGLHRLDARVGAVEAAGIVGRRFLDAQDGRVGRVGSEHGRAHGRALEDLDGNLLGGRLGSRSAAGSSPESSSSSMRRLSRPGVDSGAAGILGLTARGLRTWSGQPGVPRQRERSRRTRRLGDRGRTAAVDGTPESDASSWQRRRWSRRSRGSAQRGRAA